jgi:type 1 fimbria pilin
MGNGGVTRPGSPKLLRKDAMRHLVSTLVVSSALFAGSSAAAPVDKTPSVTGTVAPCTASQRQIEVTLPDGTVQRFHGTPRPRSAGP